MTTIWKKKSDTDCERKKDCWRGRCTSAPDIGRADGGGLWPVSDAWRFWLHQSAGLYKGFPWHPHRGIETITYLVSGTMEHEDSLGNKGVIQSMGCQWMTAGSGILHKEMPQPSERMLGCQLWVNLPAAKKWFHRHIGTLLRMTSRWWCPTRQPSGSYQAATGDTGTLDNSYVQITYLDVTLPADASWKYNEARDDENLFLYLLEGSLFPEVRQQSAESKGCAILYSVPVMEKIRTNR